jgi:phosphonate ABC transporter permease subunit PhnE
MTNNVDEGQRKEKRRTWVLALGVVAAVLLYAWAFDTTDVTLDTIEDDTRQTQLFRVLRALARPDIFERDVEEVIIEAEIYVPCQDATPAAPDTSGAYVVVTPNCADPGAEVIIEGFGLVAKSTGPIAFIPPSGASLGIGDFTVGDDGSFRETVTLRDRPSEEVQRIRVAARQEVGGLHLTETARDTIDKALETIFMALLATTIGTFFAIPLSFLASRNLMRPIKSPMVSVALGIISLPIGMFAGIWAARLARRATDPLLGNPWVDLAGIFVLGGALWGLARLWFRRTAPDGPPTAGKRMARIGIAVVAVVVAVGALYLLGDLLFELGHRLADSSTPFRSEDPVAGTSRGLLNFLARFTFLLGDLVRISIPVLAAVVVAGAVAQLGSVAGRRLVARVPDAVDRTLRYLTAAVAGAVVFVAIGFALDWFYQFDDAVRTVWVPAAVGALLGLLLAFRTRKADQVATGLTIYYLARTLFNGTRSIEPLVMAIIFVVWVGIGPFAGALALALHTTAALAKLYSEQVESISHGPIEAVQATGSNRLQTVVYAVVPQIVPPYISFTLYRWDINVRMSTIIGFVGGGGLGLILKQNVDLLQYRAAAVQMFAIAIIVASMDYVSARLRERLV